MTGMTRPFCYNHVAEIDARKRSFYVRVSRATTAGCVTPSGDTTYRQTGPGGLPLALRLSEGLGSTRHMTDHLVFVLQFSADKQVAALKTELDETQPLVKCDSGRVLGVDAEVYLPGSKNLRCIAQCVAHDLSADTIATYLRGHVNAPDKRLVRQLGHALALKANQSTEI